MRMFRRLSMVVAGNSSRHDSYGRRGETQRHDSYGRRGRFRTLHT